MPPHNPLALLRGPLIVLGVTSALIAPYLVALPWETIGLCAALLVGCVLTVWDVSNCLQDTVKAFLHQRIDHFVLDDLLKAIFHPQVGLIATVTASILGTSAMYSLAATEGQRVRLLQAGLCLRDPQVARNVLYRPGGIKLLLPAAILAWLEPPPTVLLTQQQQQQQQQQHHHHTTTASQVNKILFSEAWVEKAHDSSSSDEEEEESATALYEDEKRTTREDQEDTAHFFTPRGETTRATTQDPLAPPSLSTATMTDPPMPHHVLGSIVMETLRDKIQNAWRRNLSLPRPSALGLTGGVAALLVLIQLRNGRWIRAILMHSLQSVTMTGASSVALSLGAALLANRHNLARLSYADLKEGWKQHLGQHWKKYLAVLLLLYMRPRQRTSLKRR